LPSVRHARTKNSSKQFKPGCPGIVTRVTFIGIDMHFQLDGVTHPAKKFFENHGTIACHAQIKAIAVVFEKLLCRVGNAIKLEVHIDTDEGNACNYARATGFELFR